MTDEVDPRLVALGLVPAAPSSDGARSDWETAAPPKPATDWAVATPPAPASDWTVATPAPAPPAPAPLAAPAAPHVGISGPKPLTVGDLFPGMGKFTGMTVDAPAPAPPAPRQPTFVSPGSSGTFAPPAAPTNTFAPPAQSPAYAPPAYVAPPLASAMPVATAVNVPVAVPGKREKAKKEQKAPAPRGGKVKVASVAKAPKAEKAKVLAKPSYQLPASGVLLRGPIVMGYPEKKVQITLEQLGFRINAKEPIEVAWTDVKEIKARRGRVVVRTRTRPVAFGIPIEGISEPTLAGPLARVVKEASGGSLDLAGSSFLELQNATDTLRDHYHDEDDPLIPTVVGLVFVLAGLTISALLPDMLAIATRTPVAVGAYLVDSPLSVIDPRVFVAGFAGAAMLAAGVVRIAMGKAATAWARGTLRGWHEGAQRPVELARRGLAALVLSPAVAAALLLASLVTTLPSARVQTVIEPGGFHIVRELPFFDDDRGWSSVTEIGTVDAPTVQHFEGIAVVFKFKDRSPVSTLDGRLRGGTDKQLLTNATTWCANGGGCR